MRTTLWLKLLGSFAAVIALNLISILVIVNATTRQRYLAFSSEVETQTAERLAPIFEAYYEERGSFAGIESLLERNRMADGGRGGMRDSGAAPGMGRQGMMHMGYPFQDVPMIVITDAAGRVVADAPGELSSQLGSLRSENGVPLTAGGREVGRLYVGNMVTAGLRPADQEFLRSLQRRLLLSSAAVSVAALMLGIAVVLHITAPIRTLRQAAARIAAGDLSARVRPHSRDEIGDLGNTFNGMADSLERSALWRKQVVADLAHELRTPVALLQGHLEMMLEGVYPIDRDAIGSLHEESKTLAGLVAEVQQLASAESEATVYRREEVELSELARRLVSLYSGEARERAVEVELHAGASTATVWGDRQRLDQLLSNLLSNAVRYAPAGSRVLVELDGEAERVRLCVEDGGPGIPEAERERVFERFYRVERSRAKEQDQASYQSTGRAQSGLGLAICREIVRRHDGEIWVEEGRSGGARVCFSLPRR